MSYVPQKITPARNLTECVVCSRRFTLDRIKTHEAICQSAAVINRKRFDSSHQRITGTEVERFTKTKGKNNCAPKTPGSSPCLLSTNWRQKREDFIQKINEAKGKLAKKKINDLPLPPPAESEDEYIQCPHCLRLFNKSSASRHINACATRVCQVNSKANMNDQKANAPEPSLP